MAKQGTKGTNTKSSQAANSSNDTLNTKEKSTKVGTGSKSGAKSAGSSKKSSAAVKAIGVDQKYVRTVRILAFLIPFIAVLLGMLAGSFAPFGGKDVMTSGGMSEHLTYYYELYDRVHEGKSLVYSMTTGTGYDFTTIFTYYLSDPLNLLILIFPRTAILAVINLLYAVKIGLAGLLFSIFLTHRKKRVLAQKLAMEAQRADAIQEIADRKAAKKAKALEKAEAAGKKAKTDLVLGGSEEPKGGIGAFISHLDLPILGFSVAFALSTYMLGHGLNTAHLSVVVLFPILLMGLDQLLESGKWRLYAAMMTASVFCSFQMALIVFIFSILYAALFDYSDLHHAIRNLLLKLISDLLAVGAGAMIVLNCAGSAVFKEQISIKFPMGDAVTTFFDAAKALFPTAQSSASSGYSYGIDVFCGILAVFLLILYLGNPNINLSRKLRQAGLLVVLYTGLFLVTPNYLLNGFSHPEMTHCLFGFLFVAQLLSLAYEAFMNLEHTPFWQLHVAFVLIVTLVITTFEFCDAYDSSSLFLYAVEFAAGYYVLLMLYRSNSMTKWLLYTILPVILLAEVCMTYVDDLRMAGSKSKAYEDTLESQYYEASRLLHQAMPEAQIRVYDPSQEDYYETPVTTTLLNYHFILAPKTVETVDSTLRYMTDYKDIAIFENNYSANGSFVPSSIKDWQYEPSRPYSSINDLTVNIYQTAQVFYSAPGEQSIGYSPVVDEEKIEDVRRLDYIFAYTVTDSGDLYSSLYGLRRLGDVKSEDTISFRRRFTSWEQLPRTFQSEYVFFNNQEFLNFCDALEIAGSTAITEGSAKFAVDAPEEGYLLIPYSSLNGWDIRTSDGASVTPLSFRDQALLLPVTEGANGFTLSYRPTLFIIGIIISIAVLALLILLAVKDRITIRAGSNWIHTISSWLQENYVYVLTFAIITLVFLVMQMYTSSMPFGDRSTLVGDGYIQGVNGYSGIANSIKNGTFSTLNWNTGVAIDQYNTFSGYLMSPWSLLKLLLLPESLYGIELAFGSFLSLAFSGLTLILYLTHRRHGRTMDKKDPRLIVIGTAYALSAFGVNYFVYGNFGFLVYAPLLLLAMERLIYDRKPAMYIVLLFVQMGDAYYAFMLCEFLALYFFTMEFDSVKDFFLKGIRLALSSIAAAGLACFRLIPYYMRTLDSPYKIADTTSPIAKANGSYLSVVSDYMSHRDVVVTTDNDFRANYYVGILVLLIIPLYLINKNVKLSVRIRRSILLALYFVAFGNSTLNYIFHGFHYQSLVPNRFAAFFILLLVVMFYECLLSWKDYSRRTFCLGITLPAIALGVLWALGITDDSDSLCIVMSFLILGIYLALALLQLWKRYKKQFRAVMIAVLLVEIILNSMYTLRRSIGTTINTSTSKENIQALTKRHKDMTEPFVATEYIADEYNLAEGTDTVSDSFFSSYATVHHTDLFQQWNLLASSNSTLYQSGNPLADLMLHIKYNISNDLDDSSWSHYPIIDRSGQLELHENTNFLPLGIFFRNDEAIEAWAKTEYADYNSDGHGGNAFEFQNAFSHAMGCGDIFTPIEIETDASKITTENDSKVSYITADTSEYVEGSNNSIPTWIHIAEDVEGELYFSYFNAIVYAGYTATGESDVFPMDMHLPYGRSDYYMRIAICNMDEVAKLHDKLKDYVLENIQINFTTVSGTITAPKDGTVYLSLPNMSGWACYVDGNKVETREFMKGIGVPVTAGDHKIEIKYTPLGMWAGILISVGTLLALILFYVIRRTIRHSKKTVEK